MPTSLVLCLVSSLPYYWAIDTDFVWSLSYHHHETGFISYFLWSLCSCSMFSLSFHQIGRFSLDFHFRWLTQELGFELWLKLQILCSAAGGHRIFQPVQSFHFASPVSENYLKGHQLSFTSSTKIHVILRLLCWYPQIKSVSFEECVWYHSMCMPAHVHDSVTFKIVSNIWGVKYWSNYIFCFLFTRIMSAAWMNSTWLVTYGIVFWLSSFVR